MADINITTEITLNKASFLKDLKALRADINKALAVDGIKVTLDRKAFMKDFKAIAKEVSKGIIVPLIADDRITPVINAIRANAAAGVNVGMNGATGGGGSAASSAGSRANAAAREAAQNLVANAKIRAREIGGLIETRENNRVQGIKDLGDRAKIRAKELSGLDKAREQAAESAEAARVQGIKDLGERARLKAGEMGRDDKVRDKFNKAGVDYNEYKRLIRGGSNNLTAMGAVAGMEDRVFGNTGTAIGAPGGKGQLGPQGASHLPAGYKRYLAQKAAKDEATANRQTSLAYGGFVAANLVSKAGDYYDYYQTGQAGNRMRDVNAQYANAEGNLSGEYSGARGLGQAIYEGLGGTSMEGLTRYGQGQELAAADRAKRAADHKINIAKERSEMTIAYGHSNRMAYASRTSIHGTYGSEVGMAKETRDEEMRVLNIELAQVGDKAVKGEAESVTNARNAIKGKMRAADGAYAEAALVAAANMKRANAATQANVSSSAVDLVATQMNTNQDYFAESKLRQLGQLEISRTEARANLNAEINPEVKKRLQREFDASEKLYPEKVKNIEIQNAREIYQAKQPIVDEEFSYRQQAAREFYDLDLKMFQRNMDLKISMAPPELRGALAGARSAGVAARLSEMDAAHRDETVSLAAGRLRMIGGDVAATRMEADYKYNKRMKNAAYSPEDTLEVVQRKFREQQLAGEERGAANKMSGFRNALNIRGVLSEAKQIDLNSRGQYRAAAYEGIKGQLDIDEAANAGDPAMLAAVRRRGLAQLKEFQLNDARPRSYSSVGEYYNYMAEKITASATNPNDQANAEIKRLEADLKNQGKVVGDALKEAFKDIQIVGIFNGG